jgi:hypothetical protein
VRASLHRFLLFVLMLTLPLQALASAAMLGCMAHSEAMEQMAMADEMMAGCHESEQPASPSTSHDCKHCAACALGTALLLLPAVDTPAIVPARHSFTPHSAALFSGFIPDGPERPPRSTLA